MKGAGDGMKAVGAGGVMYECGDHAWLSRPPKGSLVRKIREWVV